MDIGMHVSFQISVSIFFFPDVHREWNNGVGFFGSELVLIKSVTFISGIQESLEVRGSAPLSVSVRPSL